MFAAGTAAADCACVFNAFEGGLRHNSAISILHSSAYYRSCTFRGLSILQVLAIPRQWNLALGALYVQGFNASLVLDNCTLTNIYNKRPIVAAVGGLVCSDNPQHTVRSCIWNTQGYCTFFKMRPHLHALEFL